MRYRITDKNTNEPKGIIFKHDNEKLVEITALQLLGNKAMESAQGEFRVEVEKNGEWVDTGIEIINQVL